MSASHILSFSPFVMIPPPDGTSFPPKPHHIRQTRRFSLSEGTEKANRTYVPPISSRTCFPYFLAFASPMPLTDFSSSKVRGRTTASSRSVLSENTA